ncbi:hypothetical protein ANN_27419 [Periplaneta americana]|uniref:Uncharacterized protein n=1 Tax=Periplaneta americana TaxID=6978 RepID=A0ABQ8RVV9_PERAM|nr:hypothetical protein ANN_27419 [Periplaneta americana]
MAGLFEGGNESPGSLKAIYKCELKTNVYKCELKTNGAAERTEPSFVYRIDSRLKMAAPFKRFREANISEIEFHRA